MLVRRFLLELSTFNDVDLDGFDGDTDFLEPFNRLLDLGALALNFQADNADFVGDTGLADVGDEFEFVAQLPDDWRGNEARRVHQPKAGGLLLI